MAGDDDLKRWPITPLETDEEWQQLHRAVHYAEQMWRVVGPVVAIVINWKAWMVGAGVFLFLNRPEGIAILDILSGITK